jgi:hypothetical protein
VSPSPFFKPELVLLDENEIYRIDKYCRKYFDPEENKKFAAHLDTREDANKVGIYGECVVGKYFGTTVDAMLTARPIHQSDPGFDILIKGGRWDIKTQVSEKAGKKLANYYMNIPEMMLRKDPKGYIWVLKWKGDWSRFWIMGYLEKPIFEKLARKHKKGDKMGDDFTYTADTYDLQSVMLNPVKNLK